MDTDDTGSVTIATISVRGEAVGDMDLELTVSALGDENGNSYSTTASGTELVVDWVDHRGDADDDADVGRTDDRRVDGRPVRYNDRSVLGRGSAHRRPAEHHERIDEPGPDASARGATRRCERARGGCSPRLTPLPIFVTGHSGTDARLTHVFRVLI